MPSLIGPAISTSTTVDTDSAVIAQSVVSSSVATVTPNTNPDTTTATGTITATVTTSSLSALSARLALLDEFTDLRFPHLWYPRTRALRRHIVLHVGPTNSGKTHSALTRLLKAPSGIYAAPLRLLAHEVYEKIVAAGVPCDLVTGQTVIRTPLARHVSCTVEMCDLDVRVAVAVIDEMQLIGDPERGWAWTRALLGLQADEIHLTGDDSAVALITSLCAKMNDTVVVKHYRRLSPLLPAKAPVGMSLHALKPGDAVITFSRDSIYHLKSLIERVNPRLKCCVVYGSLPPETRTQQAKLFNDPRSGYNCLVATDAVGLGLNLNIRRIIFSTTQKYDGKNVRELNISEVKQVAGRAGRFRSRYPVGEVSAFTARDLWFIKGSLKQATPPVKAAGLFPTYEQLEVFNQFTGGKLIFSELLELFLTEARLSPEYFLCDCNNIRQIASTLDHISPSKLSLRDRYIFCLAPVDTNSPQVLWQLVEYAQQYAAEKHVPFVLQDTPLRLGTKIEKLEEAHKIGELYVWLSYRFSAFRDRLKAEETLHKINELIKLSLEQQSKRSKTNFF
jgi:ATP-dependent RNA helicase SUPV3L1/SUV3